MCGLCGSLGGSDWTDGVATHDQTTNAPDRRRARRERAAAASRVLAPAGLTLADWQGSAFMLRGRTGAAVPVSGLLELWTQADRLSSRQKIDPLDPVLIAALGG